MQGEDLLLACVRESKPEPKGQHDCDTCGCDTDPPPASRGKFHASFFRSLYLPACPSSQRPTVRCKGEGEERGRQSQGRTGSVSEGSPEGRSSESAS